MLSSLCGFFFFVNMANSFISKPSHAAATKKKFFTITKIDQSIDEQGITFDYLLHIKLIEYFNALGEYIGGIQNIISPSRIRKNRIKFFLKTIVSNRFFYNHKFIKVASKVT